MGIVWCRVEELGLETGFVGVGGGRLICCFLFFVYRS